MSDFPRDPYAEGDQDEVGGPDGFSPAPRSGAGMPTGQVGPSRAPAAPGEGVRIITAEEVERARQGAAAEPAAPAGRTGAPAGAQPTASFPLPSDARPEDLGRPRLRPLPSDGGDPGSGGQAGDHDPLTQPVLSVGSDEPSAELPHWTEPPTGEVPEVLVTGVPGDDEERQARAAGPRWRDEHERWDDDDFVADLAPDPDSDPAEIGALDPRRPRVAPAASFDDLSVPDEPPVHARPPGGHAGPSAAAPDPGVPDAGIPGAEFPPGGPGGDQPVAPGAPPGRRMGRGLGRGGGNGGGRPPGVGGGDRNMGQAVGVGVAIAAVALFLAWLGAPWMLLLVEVVIVVAAYEYLSALRRAGLEPPMALGLVAVAALPLAAYARGDAALPMVMFLLLLFSMVWFLVGAGPGRPVRDIGTMLLAVVHVGILGAFAALILRIGPIDGAAVDQGVSILILAVVAAVFYDVGGLFLGRRFGRTPLSSASPNKTREGLIGGMAASIIAVMVAVFFPLFGLTTFSFFQALVFAIACSVAAFVGDLSESLVKRDLGVKDMGDLLPGHGGVLDRFDGMLFVLPAAYYTVLVLFG